MSVKALQYVKWLVRAPNGEKISAAEKGVLMQLADDHNEDKGCAWPSIAKLGPRCGMAERHCRRIMRKLEEMKLIESNPRLRENGGRSSSEYRFCEIDPPFDAKAIAITSKRMQLQAAMRTQRPKQANLYPPDTDVRGAGTTETGGRGQREHNPPDTDVRGAGTPPSGPELLVEPPVNQEAELPLDPKGNPLPPAGVKVDPVESERWNRFRVLLKSELWSIPDKVAKRQGFTVIKPSPGYEALAQDNDYDVCFRNWWLDSVRVMPNGILLVTSADDEEATAAGMKKYKDRLARIARPLFARGAERPISFKLDRRAAPAAPLALQPKPSGEWTAVKRRVEAALHDLPPAESTSAVANFLLAIEPTKLLRIEMDGAAPVWTIGTTNVKKTSAVLTMLHRHVSRALDQEASSAVQLRVVDLRESS